MKENIIKFRLSNSMIEQFPETDFEYTAHIAIDGDIKVTWIEGGEKQEVYYDTTEVEEYFENGTWVKI